VKANSKIWLKDVDIAEAKSLGANFTPSGNLRNIPLIGVVKEVIVDETNFLNEVMVQYRNGTDQQYAGLVYLKGLPPPPDSCNVHLSGP